MCWVPFFAYILLTIVKPPEAVSYLYTAIVSCTVYSSSAINPLVYGCLNQEFKDTYKRLVKCFFHLPRPRCLSNDDTVAQVPFANRRFAKSSTVTAKIPITQLETMSQNFRPGSFLNDTRRTKLSWSLHITKTNWLIENKSLTIGSVTWHLNSDLARQMDSLLMA